MSLSDEKRLQVLMQYDDLNGVRAAEMARPLDETRGSRTASRGGLER